jgi:tRNA U34 5-methylaminomethyl-2-thiouridine-forming methyltransferase MnmC
MEGFQGERVLTGDGTYTIRHPVYGEEFHSWQGARFESEELYMKASGFQAAIDQEARSIGVLDVGLGLGYNALMTLETWMNSSGLCEISMVSLEQTEELLDGLVSEHTGWKEGWSHDWRRWSQALTKQSDGRWQASFTHPQSGRSFHWIAYVGDARQVPFAPQSLDFVWQDAFSPKKNPELWTVEWFQKIKDAARGEACLVTYSVARVVKDNLTSAGWCYERVQAAGQKRQWLKARV